VNGDSPITDVLWTHYYQPNKIGQDTTSSTAPATPPGSSCLSWNERKIGAWSTGAMKFTPWENPMGTDGFEFIEYAAPDPAAMAAVFERMGFTAIARHRHKEVTLYRQGEINFILNADPESFAQRFARLHGPSVCAIAFRVQDAASAYRRATSLGAWGFANRAGPGSSTSRRSRA
jgi:4-hydroxyphenylpyruvate dioxygenase-like putative hemolysin